MIYTTLINSKMKTPYKIPTETRIGHVHLKVSNLQNSLAFYCDLLGFEITTMYGTEAAFISAGGYHHHIGLNTWYSKNFPLAHEKGVGLFHIAILYPMQMKTLQQNHLRCKAILFLVLQNMAFRRHCT